MYINEIIDNIDMCFHHDMEKTGLRINRCFLFTSHFTKKDSMNFFLQNIEENVNKIKINEKMSAGFHILIWNLKNSQDL